MKRTKKKPAKQPPPNPQPHSASITKLQRCLAYASTVALSACSAIATDSAPHYSFQNPPTTGSSFKPQHIMVVCETLGQAMAVSASGLFVSGCEWARDDSYQVDKVSRESLPEGDVWIVETTSEKGAGFIPLPWHNWV